MVTRADASAQGDGIIIPAEQAWFAARGPGRPIGHIHIPTLLVRETVDPVFSLGSGPVDVTLAGHAHTTTVPLEMVAFTGQAHRKIELQLVATTVGYAIPRLGGSIDFGDIRVVLPTVTGVKVVPTTPG